MKTTYLAKPGDIARKSVVVDAAGVPLGRLAVKVANALRGKDKPTYTPHIDTGVNVIVINAKEVLLTGKKSTDKIYQSYSGFRSGLKELTADVVREKNPERMIRDAVWGMMPKGRLGRAMFKKLRVYAGAEHRHAAQQPETMTI